MKRMIDNPVFVKEKKCRFFYYIPLRRNKIYSQKIKKNGNMNSGEVATRQTSGNEVITESMESKNYIGNSSKDDFEGDSDVEERDSLPGEKSSDVSIFEPEIEIQSYEDNTFEMFDEHNESDERLANNEDFSSSDSNEGGKKSATKLLRSARITKKDDNELMFHCPMCDRAFSTISAMKGHVVKSHKTTLGKSFTCPICGALGSSKRTLKRHLMRTHKGEKVDMSEFSYMKCSFCDSKFLSSQILYEHIRVDHKEEMEKCFKCDWCPAIMKSKSSMQRHYLRIHPGKFFMLQKNFKCDLCDEAFTTKLGFQKHRKYDHPAGNTCDICGSKFRYNSGLVKHKAYHTRVEEVKQEKIKYSCDSCNKFYSSKKSLAMHVTLVHVKPAPPQRDYTCRVCGEKFPTALQNNRHYRKTHRRAKMKLYCGKCKITFDTPEQRKEHLKVHPVTCDICNKAFLQRDILREHRLIHFSPKHKCPHCDKMFTQRSNLKRHIRLHTGEKPFKCSHCDRVFSDKSACNSHEKIHTGVERSTCPYCGVSFAKRQKLNYHLRIHTGLDLIYCPLCSRPCTNSYSLRKHVESHELTLTRALISVGFQSLLLCDPNFVSRALMELSKITIEKVPRHENTPTPFLDGRKNSISSSEKIMPCNLFSKVLNSPAFGNQAGLSDIGEKDPLFVETEDEGSQGSLSGNNCEEKDTRNGDGLSNVPCDPIEIGREELSDIPKFRDHKTCQEPLRDTAKDSSNIDSSVDLADRRAEDNESIVRREDNQILTRNEESLTDNQKYSSHYFDPYKDVVKFLRSMLEKEAARINLQRLKRKNSRKRIKSDLQRTKASSSSQYSLRERNSGGENSEFPITIGENLLEKCLEIIMDENPSMEAYSHQDPADSNTVGVKIGNIERKLSSENDTPDNEETSILGDNTSEQSKNDNSKDSTLNESSDSASDAESEISNSYRVGGSVSPSFSHNVSEPLSPRSCRPNGDSYFLNEELQITDEIYIKEEPLDFNLQ